MGKKASILVCVTGQRDCDRLIRVGKKLAAERSIPMQVLCVQPTSAGYDANCEELEYLRQTAQGADAEMTVYFDDSAALIAVGFIKQTGATHVVTGMAGTPGVGLPSNGFIEMVHQLVPEIPISMVAKDGTIYNICPANKKSRQASCPVV